MMVEVRFFGKLKKYGDKESRVLLEGLREPVQVAQILETLKVPQHKISIISINGKIGSIQSIINSDAILILSDFMAGG
jgi:hypothetical protein